MAHAVYRDPTAFSLDKSSRKTKREEDPGHLAFVRRLPSIISGEHPCEACHIRAGSPVHRKVHTGIARKPDDFWTLPLTPAEHREQHAGSELEFWRQHGIDPFEAALKLYDLSGQFDAAVRFLASLRPVLWPASTDPEHRETSE